ncbi:hypothetical protein, partial [Burkholderia sp. SIMBA_024]|uniref:hypothetical protein n=1 Tax=Burkholderia sp. SIMBA_024 TaxID=3085768 RepID=UPI003979AE4E
IFSFLRPLSDAYKISTTGKVQINIPRKRFNKKVIKQLEKVFFTTKRKKISDGEGGRKRVKFVEEVNNYEVEERLDLLF